MTTESETRITEILKKQREFFRSGKTLSPAYRLDCLKRLRETLLRRESEIAGALKEDLGKCRQEAYMTEIGMVLSELSCAKAGLRKWARPRRAQPPLALFPSRCRIIPEPYGNVLIISPWNYPFLLCVAPLVSTVAAGNTAVLKPSEHSPATSAVIRSIMQEVFPEELVTVIEGDAEMTAGLLERKFDYIFFTGGSAVGRIVMEKAAVHLTPVTLELGGKCPVIVDKTADPEVSAARIIFGKCLNCGQTCVAPDYVMVHEDIADAFVEACRRQVRKMCGDGPLDDPDYGKIVSRRHFDRISAMLDECTGGSHECTIFGGRRDADSLKIEPTIIRLGRMTDEKNMGLRIMTEEIFGPLLPVLTYGDIEDVIRQVDGNPKPLAAYVFTRDAGTKNDILRRLRFGGGCVNDTVMHLVTESLPFGGTGESGMGNYHGKYGFDTFSHLKSIVERPFFPDPPMRYRPYTALKEKLVRIFMR